MHIILRFLPKKRFIRIFNVRGTKSGEPSQGTYGSPETPPLKKKLDVNLMINIKYNINTIV